MAKQQSKEKEVLFKQYYKTSLVDLIKGIRLMAEEELNNNNKYILVKNKMEQECFDNYWKKMDSSLL